METTTATVIVTGGATATATATVTVTTEIIVGAAAIRCGLCFGTLEIRKNQKSEGTLGLAASTASIDHLAVPVDKVVACCPDGK